MNKPEVLESLDTRLGRMPGTLYSDMLPEKLDGKAVFTVFEARRKQDNRWEITVGHRQDMGVSAMVRVDADKTVAKGLDFVTMMETMHALEKRHPNFARKRPMTGWRKVPSFRDYDKLLVAAIAESKISPERLRHIQRHKPISRRPSLAPR